MENHWSRSIGHMQRRYGLLQAIDGMRQGNGRGRDKARYNAVRLMRRMQVTARQKMQWDMYGGYPVKTLYGYDTNGGDR